MPPDIRTMSFGGVNCYLIKSGSGFTLIDTGYSKHRDALEKELERAGCRPGDLKLIVITHGDSDHSGNAAHLRDKHGAKIAIHRAECQVVKRGDMLLSRTHRPFLNQFILPFFQLSESDRFTPDLTVEDGTDLVGYGLDGRVLHLPGHTTGSIGVLTAAGDLFCGDLLTNNGRPSLDSFMDDLEAAQASLTRLLRLEINTVYPGPGKPFPMEQLRKNR